MAYRLDPKKIAHLSAAAAAGLALFGCNRQSSNEAEQGAHQATGTAPDIAAKVAPMKTKDGKECCMGLNECKGKGGCAVPESNSCAGKNECKGKGGCNMHCPK